MPAKERPVPIAIPAADFDFRVRGVVIEGHAPDLSGADLAAYVAFHMNAWPPRDDLDQGPVRRSSVREMRILPVRPSSE